jgi:hypothetical protein
LRASRILSALSSLAVVAAGLAFAPAASANSVQVQSYQRASQSEACAAQAGETPWEAAWGVDSSWAPSWEQWANGGTGGWTCTRSITWAKDTARASLGCTQFQFAVNPSLAEWVDFGSGHVAPPGSLIYVDSDCTVLAPDPQLVPYMAVVWAADSDAAAALCLMTVPQSNAEHSELRNPTSIYVCFAP